MVNGGHNESESISIVRLEIRLDFFVELTDFKKKLQKIVEITEIVLNINIFDVHSFSC